MMHSQADDPPSKKKAIVAVGIIVAVGFALFGHYGTFSETAFDPATAKCDDGGLTRQAKDLIEDNTSPLFGKVSILKAGNYRPNTTYGKEASNFTKYGGMSQKEIQEDMFADRKHQCAADIITNRGEMTMYYVWKTIDGTVYIEARAMPSID